MNTITQNLNDETSTSFVSGFRKLLAQVRFRSPVSLFKSDRTSGFIFRTFHSDPEDSEYERKVFVEDIEQAKSLWLTLFPEVHPWSGQRFTLSLLKDGTERVIFRTWLEISEDPLWGGECQTAMDEWMDSEFEMAFKTFQFTRNAMLGKLHPSKRSNTP